MIGEIPYPEERGRGIEMWLGPLVRDGKVVNVASSIVTTPLITAC